MISPITTHVLDTSIGKPAIGVAVTLEVQESDGRWSELARGVTDADGRVGDLLADGSHIHVGTYRMTFQTAEYFRHSGKDCFYPEVAVKFVVENGGHYHVPLLLSPFGFSTYRGS